MCENAIVFANAPEGVSLEEGKTYYFCMCGRSADGLFCDGSHKDSGCTPKAFTVDKTDTYYVCRCKTSKDLPFCDGSHKQYADEKVGGPVGA